MGSAIEVQATEMKKSQSEKSELVQSKVQFFSTANRRRKK